MKALEFDLYHSKQQGIDFALEKYELDAILFPSDEGCEISAKAGYPTIAVPAGYTSGENRLELRLQERPLANRY